MAYAVDPLSVDHERVGVAWGRVASAGLFVALVLLGSFLPASAQTAGGVNPEKRIALVIGNNAYQHAAPLSNAVNDARRMGEALRQLKFEVDEQFDSDGRTLGRALRDFGVRAQTSDVALLFYAGHGVQVDRENYIVPVDAKLDRERDLLYESIPLDLFLGETSQARKIGIVILDACRNNPFTERIARSMRSAGRAVSVGKGLARVDRVPRNTVVAMSTAADQVAEDGTGQNSPFTEAMLSELQRPGVELSLFFRSVRDSVLRSTYNRQEPYIFSSIGAEPFFFNPRPPNRAPEIAALTPLQVPDIAGPTPIGMARPTDPDDDPLTVRIVGLPRFGEIRVAGNKPSPNELVPLDRFMTSTYKPDGRSSGQVGTFDFLIEDGRGGSAMASLPIVVIPSNQRPVVEGERVARVHPGALGITAPTDPDGDALTIAITGLPPRGVVRRGTATVKTGERLRAGDLAELTYTPEPGVAGPVGTLSYTVDDGRGGKVEGRVRIEVARVSDSALLVSEAALWEVVREKGDPDDMAAFARLFPQSRFLDEWQSVEKPIASVESETRSTSSSAAPAQTPAVAADLPGLAAGAPAPIPARKPELPPAARQSDPSEATVRGEPASPTLRPNPALASIPASPPQATEPPRTGGEAQSMAPVARSDSAAAAPPRASPVDGSSTGRPPAPPERGSEPRPTADVVTAQAPLGSLPSGVAAARPQDASRQIQDCPACPVLVPIPEGTFLMGEAGGDSTTAPQHRVSVRSFALAQHPVTVAQFKECVTDGACGSLPRMLGAQDRTPIHNVSWEDAQQYIAWLTRKTGKKYRLPSEAEWEYAARANSATRYWWGNDAGAALANCADCGGTQNGRTPLAVDAYKPNPFGLYDIHGGVAEWVQDCWFPSYQGAPSDGSAREQKGCRSYVLRGGSFRSKKNSIAVTARNSYDGSVRYLENGFRVARNLD